MEVSLNSYLFEVLDFYESVNFFALIIVIIASHKGFNRKGEAEGVGRATTW
jgi:ABC-type transporter Mla maintaining outer membrane lipid asymmetry permease subunit MlaE